MIFNSLRKSPQIGILYFFFNHANRAQKSEDVIRVLLRQMVGQLEKIPDAINAEYFKYKTDPHKTMPSGDSYTKLLTACIDDFFKAYFNPVFILVDAYDEFKNAENERKERKVLLSCLRQLCLTDKTRILITTRPQYREELRIALPGQQIIDIEANPADVEKYLNQRIKHEPLSNELKDAIKATITEACQRR